MPYTYVRFTSKNHDDDQMSRFTVNLPQPIQNAVSVHVKSFSMPNTPYNVTDANKTFGWYEAIGDATTDVAYLETFIPPKFYTIADLLSTMATAMTTASQLAKTASFATVSTQQTSGSLTYTMAQIPNTTTVNTFHVELTATADDTTTSAKSFVPVTHKFSLWCILGFQQEFRIDTHHRGRITPQLQALTLYTDPVLNTNDVRMNALPSATAAATLTIVAPFAPRDSHESFHITSSLARAVYEAEGDEVAHHTDYLLVVPNTSNRYSWVQYIPTEPVFHTLDGQNIRQFTIGLADENGIPFKHDEHQHFSVVLAFEWQEMHRTLNANQLQALEYARSHC